MWRRGLLLAMVAGGMSGCGLLRGNIAPTDNSAVQTPIYSANKVLFMGNATNDGRYAPLKETHEQAVSKGGVRRQVQNRQPLSIVVSKAYVPSTLRICNNRPSDLFYPKGRDIAVLPDVSTSSDKQDFIAVWYQRDVPPDTSLSFQDLLVYSTDAWDAKYPPYFRLRLVDVSSERNTALGALLDQVRSASPSITSSIGAPEAAPIVNIAALAAKQVLAHGADKSLVDFTFQLYGGALLNEAGGVPLGVLETGGLLVTALPCNATANYWNALLRFDHRLDRIEAASGQEPLPMPYVAATIMTAVRRFLRSFALEALRY